MFVFLKERCESLEKKKIVYLSLWLRAIFYIYAIFAFVAFEGKEYERLYNEKFVFISFAITYSINNKNPVSSNFLILFSSLLQLLKIFINVS